MERSTLRSTPSPVGGNLLVAGGQRLVEGVEGGVQGLVGQVEAEHLSHLGRGLVPAPA